MITAPCFYINLFFAGDSGDLSILLYKTFLCLLGIVTSTLSFYIKPGCFVGDNGDLSILLSKTSVSLFARDDGDHSILLCKICRTFLGIVATALSFYMNGIYLTSVM